MHEKINEYKAHYHETLLLGSQNNPINVFRDSFPVEHEIC